MRSSRYGAGDYAPVRRPLDLLDLVRLGTTSEAARSVHEANQLLPGRCRGGRGYVDHNWDQGGSLPCPFEAVSSPCRKHRVLGARQPHGSLAEDVDELKGLIDDQLLFDARRRLEAQILAGNGTSPNLRGLDSTTGVLAQGERGQTASHSLWRRE